MVLVGRASAPAPRRALAPAADGLAVGVSTRARAGELGAAYHEASLALRTVAGGGVRSLPDTPPFDYLMLREDDVARRLIDPAIARFVREDRRTAAR